MGNDDVCQAELFLEILYVDAILLYGHDTLLVDIMETLGKLKRRAAVETTAVINELASAESGAVVFASSTGKQYSYENSAWGNGAFTKATVEGINGKADYTGKGKITINMLDLYLSERVKELTNGEIAVQVYHSRQLGDARDNVENVRNGSIAITTLSVSNLSQVLPVLDVWSLPYIFKSDDHYWYVLNHPKSWEFMKQLEPKGMRIITWITSGARNFFTQKPIRSTADLKGMKIRVMASPVMINTMKAFGASGVPTAWGELYTALQTGVVDAAENNHPSLISMKFYEVTKYYTLDEHMRIPDLSINPHSHKTISSEFF
jgi:tripartite ATP-independent transporter DctP family solute receptor